MMSEQNPCTSYLNKFSRALAPPILLTRAPSPRSQSHLLYALSKASKAYVHFVGFDCKTRQAAMGPELGIGCDRNKILLCALDRRLLVVRLTAALQIVQKSFERLI